MMKKDAITVGALRTNEIEEADRIFRLAFGTFLGLPDPTQFMGDRNMVQSRVTARNTKSLAARDGNGRLVGTNLITRWGSSAFFGPLTVLPEYWDRGVAQKLLIATVKIFDSWKLPHSGLFTFPHSTRHVGLYNKFGYWPGSLTALMRRTPDNIVELQTETSGYIALSSLKGAKRADALKACARLAGRLERGVDLSDEIRSLLAHHLGEVLLTYTRTTLDGFAICMTGAGSEGGEKICYVKFAAVRAGDGAGSRFDRLLDAIEEFAVSRSTEIEAGMSLARRDAYTRMRGHGYKAYAQGVAMHRGKGVWLDRADVHAISDWR